MKEKYINPFTDFGFKKLFGTEVNKELLIDFLNQLLEGKEQIADLTYLNNEQQGNIEDDRKSIYDLYCENERGEKFIVELQNVKQIYFKDRSIYYSTFPIQDQAVKGDWDYQLKAVYTIGILNFIFDAPPYRQFKYFHRVKLVETETNEIFYNKLTFIYIEIPKFRKEIDELKSHFDKWMYVLKNLHQLQDRPKALQERVFKKLFEVAEIVKYNPEEMNAYERSLKTYRDNQAAMQYAIETAVQEAVEKAKQEKVVEIAREMKRNGIAIEIIMKSTGLTKAEVEQL